MAEEKAAQFLKNIDIKSAMIGGFDKEDTFIKLKELALLYEDILAEYREQVAQHEDIVADYKEQIAQLESELDTKQRELLLANGKITKLMARIKAEPEAAPAPVVVEPDADEELKLNQRREEILAGAQEEARNLLSTARLEAERIRETAKLEGEGLRKKELEDSLRNRAELYSEIKSLNGEKDTVLMELRVIKEQLDTLLTAE